MVVDNPSIESDRHTSQSDCNGNHIKSTSHAIEFLRYPTVICSQLTRRSMCLAICVRQPLLDQRRSAGHTSTRSANTSKAPPRATHLLPRTFLLHLPSPQLIIIKMKKKMRCSVLTIRAAHTAVGLLRNYSNLTRAQLSAGGPQRWLRF